MNRCALVCAALVAGAGASARADVLWDQSALDWNGPAFINSISGSPPFGATAYAVADITVPAGGWTVDRITMYFSQIESDWSTTVTQGRLYIQPKTGGMPTVNPGGALIPMSAVVLFDPTVQQAYAAVSASGLAATLAPGDYWVGITPVAAGGFFGPERGISSLSNLGASTAIYDPFGPPAGWFSMGADAAVLVEGRPVPAPAGLGALLGGAALAARRRRAR